MLPQENCILLQQALGCDIKLRLHSFSSTLFFNLCPVLIENNVRPGEFLTLRKIEEDSPESEKKLEGNFDWEYQWTKDLNDPNAQWLLSFRNGVLQPDENVDDFDVSTLF